MAKIFKINKKGALIFLLNFRSQVLKLTALQLPLAILTQHRFLNLIGMAKKIPSLVFITRRQRISGLALKKPATPGQISNTILPMNSLITLIGSRIQPMMNLTEVEIVLFVKILTANGSMKIVQLLMNSFAKSRILTKETVVLVPLILKWFKADASILNHEEKFHISMLNANVLIKVADFWNQEIVKLIT